MAAVGRLAGDDGCEAAAATALPTSDRGRGERSCWGACVAVGLADGALRREVSRRLGRPKPSQKNRNRGRGWGKNKSASALQSRPREGMCGLGALHQSILRGEPLAASPLEPSAAAAPSSAFCDVRACAPSIDRASNPPSTRSSGRSTDRTLCRRRRNRSIDGFQSIGALVLGFDAKIQTPTDPTRGRTTPVSNRRPPPAKANRQLAVSCLRVLIVCLVRAFAHASRS